MVILALQLQDPQGLRAVLVLIDPLRHGLASGLQLGRDDRFPKLLEFQRFFAHEIPPFLLH
jgi:hypothetical protein